MPYTEIKKSVYFEIFKRTTDIIFSVILLIAFAPVLLFLAILIKLDSCGPIFADTPERVGRNGKLFKMYKLRSMVQNAHDILRNNPKYSRLFVEYKKGSYKLKFDPRITNIGSFIRKHSLDEVPQLLNVLKGDMSLVGPRAYYPDELREQQKEYPDTRDDVKIVLSVKPGITGFWQVSGRSEVNFDKRVKMDSEYVKKRSIVFDLMIIFRTPWAMVSGKGAL